jgi:hypothetical protein
VMQESGTNDCEEQIGLSPKSSDVLYAERLGKAMQLQPESVLRHQENVVLNFAVDRSIPPNNVGKGSHFQQFRIV